MILYKDFIKEKVNNEIKVKSAEGYPCAFDNSKGRPLKDYKLYGNSIQDGTPTPESPVEVQSVGDLTTKNLLYSNATTRTINGVTMTYDNGVITLNGTCTTSANFELGNIALCANTYTLSANANKVPVNNTYSFVQLYDSTNNQQITVSNSKAQECTTVTTTVDGNFIYRVRIHVGCVYDNVILKPQLELGSAATEYEPYRKYDIPIVVNDTTTHIYLDEPLRKFKDYADYIDFKRGKIVRNITAGVLDGSEGWNISVTRYYYYNTKLNIKCLGNEVAGIRSNALPSVPWNLIRNSGTGIATYTNGTVHNRIDIRADGVWATVDEAKEYMANNPIHYIAPCLEPVEEEIELPKILTQKGSNIITVATEIEPSYIEVKYIAK